MTEDATYASVCRLDFQNRQTWQKLPRWIFRGRMLSPTEKALAIALLDAWDSIGQPRWFYASNHDLIKLAGLSKQAFLMARRRLVTKLLLQIKPGNRILATRYSLPYDLISKLKNHDPLNTKSLVGVPDLDHLQGGAGLLLDHPSERRW